MQVLGINPGKMMMGGESPAMVKQFAKQTGVSFPVGFDNGASYKDFRYGASISPFPMDIIIDRQGRIAYANREYNADAMVAVIEKILADDGK